MATIKSKKASKPALDPGELLCTFNQKEKKTSDDVDKTQFKEI